MNLLDELTIDDLDEEQRELADCIGMEAYRKLVATYAGSPINVRMPDKLTLKQRNRKIRSEFNGYNFSELAKRYELSERQIRNIVSDETAAIRNKPLDDQISFF